MPVTGYGGAEIYASPVDGAVWQGVGTSTAAQAGCGSAGGFVQATNVAPNGTAEYVLIGADGNPIATEAVTCAPGPGGGATAAPPPPPPTGSEVWQTATRWEPLVSSNIEVNPQTLGLTGLASWFWLSNPTTSLPPLTVSVAGYSVTASATIASYTWTFGDGDTAPAYAPGSPSAPAAIYTYQQKGSYQVSVIAHYVGSYTFSGNGLAPQTAALNIDVTMGSLDYGVQEARSVLVDPGSQNQ
ncbi:MAG TPA: PKD domain-containing protein [Acidimicrobiales bacterium]|nr:PKD domain-containing protein [Acidimicrobiales bacterium]